MNEDLIAALREIEAASWRPGGTSDLMLQMLKRAEDDLERYGGDDDSLADLRRVIADGERLRMEYIG